MCIWFFKNLVMVVKNIQKTCLLLVLISIFILTYRLGNICWLIVRFFTLFLFVRYISRNLSLDLFWDRAGILVNLLQTHKRSLSIMAPTYFLNTCCCRLSKQVLSTYLYYPWTVHKVFLFVILKSSSERQLLLKVLSFYRWFFINPGHKT